MTLATDLQFLRCFAPFGNQYMEKTGKLVLCTNVTTMKVEALTLSCGKLCFSGNGNNSFHQQSTDTNKPEQHHLPH